MIDELHNIGFIHIPGTGGSAIKKQLHGTFSLASWAWGRAEFDQFSGTANHATIWFTVVRHPLDRLCSMACGWYRRHRELFPRADDDKMEFRSTVYSWICNKMAEGNNQKAEDFHHFEFRQQAAFIAPGVWVMRWERLQEDWKIFQADIAEQNEVCSLSPDLPQVNVSKRPADITEELRTPGEIAHGIVASCHDMAKFGYRWGCKTLDEWKELQQCLPNELRSLAVLRQDGKRLVSI